MKRRNLKRFWALQLFNEDPSVANRTFNMAAIVCEAALSNSHMLSDEMTVQVTFHCVLLCCCQRKHIIGGHNIMKHCGKKNSMKPGETPT